MRSKAALATAALLAISFRPAAAGFEVEGPYHGSPQGVVYGGHAEIRFGHDRTMGVSNPDWLSFPRISAFATSRLSPSVSVIGEAAYEHSVDELTLERVSVEVQVGRTLYAHGGVILLPLLRANFERESPLREFSEPSMVAEELVGVPSSQMGVGIRRAAPSSKSGGWSYELDVVAGYDGGLVDDSPLGTRVAEGRNATGDNNGVPALAARAAYRVGSSTEIGRGMSGGPYNTTEIDGVRIDDSRMLYLFAGDVGAHLGRARVTGEVAMASIDVPPSLIGIYAESQWGASLEISDPLFAPLIRSWKQSSLTAALRLDAVDFDRDIAGDSKSRVSANLNFRPAERGVVRGGWYYQIRRDRFDNSIRSAGLAASLAIFF
jgi:hypothetical protein